MAAFSAQIMQACIGVAESVGGRERQEDRVAAQVSGNTVLLVVADGMGGHADGDKAAEILVETALELHDAADNPASDPEALFGAITRTAYDRIAELGGGQGAPHTTVALALVDAERRAWWAHLGDSRVYRLNQGAEPWRTSDHSVIQMLFLEGKITEQEMATHPEQNKLWRSLGGERYHTPTMGGGQVLAGQEVLLLCSDGMWEQVRPGEMLDTAQALPPPEAAQELARVAERRGGEGGDNISVALWVTPWQS